MRPLLEQIVPLRGSLPEADQAGVEPVSSEPGPEVEVLRRQISTQLAASFVQLSPNQRAAVLLQVQDGLTSRENAHVLNCSENTARVHIHRGLRCAQEAVEERRMKMDAHPQPALVPYVRGQLGPDESEVRACISRNAAHAASRRPRCSQLSKRCRRESMSCRSPNG